MDITSFYFIWKSQGFFFFFQFSDVTLYNLKIDLALIGDNLL
jgi:hypothetical protein